MGVNTEPAGTSLLEAEKSGAENDDAAANERREALETILARLRAGESEPWLWVTGGQLAAGLGDWPLALECLRCLDPLGEDAEELRQHLHALGVERQIPQPPDDLVADPAELVARVFTQVASPSVVMERAGAHGYQWFGFVTVALLGATLPGAWSSVIWSATLAAHLMWLLWVGIHVRDDAWCHPTQPSGPVTQMEAAVQRTSWYTQFGAMLAIAGPLCLGFFGGLGWFLMLATPTAMIGLLILMSEPLQGVGWSFPFGPNPRPREWGALAFAAMITTAAGLLSAFLAWTGFAAMLPHLLVTTFTWLFVNRTAGLLAHRVHLRLNAQARARQPLSERPMPLSALTHHPANSATAPTPIAHR